MSRDASNVSVQEVAKVTEDINDWLKVHPATPDVKGAALLLAYLAGITGGRYPLPLPVLMALFQAVQGSAIGMAGLIGTTRALVLAERQIPDAAEPEPARVVEA